MLKGGGGRGRRPSSGGVWPELLVSHLVGDATPKLLPQLPRYPDSFYYVTTINKYII